MALLVLFCGLQVRRVMTGPAALFLFTRLMEHLAVWRSTGLFIAVIRMMIVNTASWSVLFILFEVCRYLVYSNIICGIASNSLIYYLYS